MPDPDTPRELVTAWLDFHKEELSKEIDAVFVFSRQGMEIWCRGEEKPFSKLMRIIEPLQKNYRIDIYMTRRPKKRYPNIPASFLENRELRAYLRPGMNTRVYSTVRSVKVGDEIVTIVRTVVEPTSQVAFNEERLLRSRLRSFAERLLTDSRRMRQYASDLQELAALVSNPSFDPALRKRAESICRKHVKDLLKNVKRMKKDLSHAFPKAKTKEKTSARKEENKPPTTAMSLTGKAEKLAADARDVYRSIYRFVYPVQHTVDLDDLRNPGLIVAFEELESEISDFSESLQRI